MTNHEEASVSLKALLLVFALVVIGALSYLVLSNQGTTDTEDAAVVVKKKTTATATPTTTSITTTANKTTFTDTKFGFSITYPNTWKLTKRTEESTYVGDVVYEGHTASPGSVIDTTWSIRVNKDSTIAKQLDARKREEIASFNDGVTDLKEGSVKFTTDTLATTLSLKINVAPIMFYYLAVGSMVFEIQTDGSADQTAVAKSFTFTN